MKLIIFLFLLFLFISFETHAQSFDIGAQIRPRAEFRHGYRSLIGDQVNPAAFISQRTRLNVNYASKVFKTGLSLQDVRVWGDVSTSNKADLNGMMIHQAWGEFFIHPKISIKAGRQVISYDDQRLFGTVDWLQQGRSHDALLIKITPKQKVSIQAGIAYNQSSEKDTGNFYTLANYKALQYLWSHYEGDNLNFSFILVNNGLPQNTVEDGKTVQKIRYSQTFGPYLTYKYNDLKVTFAGYIQTGKNAKNAKKLAYFASSDLGYSVSKQVSTGVGFQFLSGNSQVDPDNTDYEFSTLYSSGHKFNGWMDYFYAGSSHQGVGLVDIYVPLIYKKKNLTAEAQIHYFMASADVKQASAPAKKMNSGLGTEAGIMLTYSFLPEMSISGGYSQMFGTETLQAIKGGNRERTQNWAFIMFSFNPTFFKSEK